MRNHRFWAGPVLATLSFGCVHEHERAGDEALAAHKYDEARSGYDRALGDSDLYGYESRRIAEKRAEAVSAEAKADLERFRASGGFEALVALRQKALGQNLPASQIAEIQDAIEAAVEQRMPEADRLVSAKRFGAADERATELASETRGGSPARARAEAIRREGAAHHGALSASARTPARRLLHARIAEGFGGPAAQDSVVREASALVAVAWKIDVSGARCGSAAERIRSNFARDAGTAASAPNAALGTMVVDLRCSSSDRRYQAQESYTYYEDETYTDQEPVTRDVTNTVMGEQECHQESRATRVQLAGQDKTELVTVCGHGTKQVTSQETTYRSVTKTRRAARTGQRNVTRREVTTRTDGSAHVSIDAASAESTLSLTKTADDLDSAGAAIGEHAESAAVSAVIAKLSDAVAEAQEKRARPLVAAGDAALAAGRTDDAEESFTLAYLETGHAAPRFAEHLVAAYGLSASALLSGGGRARLGDPPSAGTGRDQVAVYEEAPKDAQRGGVAGTEIAIGGVLAQSADLGPQGNRAIVGAYLHFRRAGFSSIFFDSPWGFGVFDQLEAEGFFGARTTTGFRTTDGNEERAFGFGGGVAYRALVGYRASRFGVFAGVEPRAMVQVLGDVTQTGYFGPLMAQLELRIAGPAVVSMTAWMSPTTSGTHSMGADVVIPLGRSWWGLRVAAERRYMHTELPLADGGDGSDSAGIRETDFATGSLVMPF